MKRKKSMCDFVYGRCEGVNKPAEFVSVWLKTNKNPCSVCGKDKSKCRFYNGLVDKEVIGEEGNPT